MEALLESALNSWKQTNRFPEEWKLQLSFLFFFLIEFKSGNHWIAVAGEVLANADGVYEDSWLPAGWSHWWDITPDPGWNFLRPKVFGLTSVPQNLTWVTESGGTSTMPWQVKQNYESHWCFPDFKSFQRHLQPDSSPYGSTVRCMYDNLWDVWCDNFWI